MADTETVDDQLDELRTKQTELLALGKSRQANALFRREQELISARDGSRPIVGKGGRAA